MRFFVGVGFLLLLIFPVTAQDDELITIQLSGAFDVTVPESWDIVGQNGAGYILETENSTVNIRGYSPLIANLLSLDTTADALMEYVILDVFENREYDSTLVEEASFGEYDGIMMTYEQLEQGQSYERTVMVLEWENDYTFVGHINPLEGETLDSDDVQVLADALSSITQRPEFTFYDNTIIPIPEDWFVFDDDNYGIAHAAFSNGDMVVDITFWPRYGDIAGFEVNRDFLAYIYDNSYGDNAPFVRSETEDTTVAGFDAIYFPYNRETLNTFDMYPIGVISFATQPNNTYLTASIMASDPDADLDPAYDLLDTIRPGNRNVCPLFTDPGDRVRARPTVNSDLVLEADGEVLIAVAQTVGDDGFIWFDVRVGWIRQDVVFYENNTCEDIPEL